MDAQNIPVKRAYTRRETHTEDMEIGQKPDIDLDSDFNRTESLETVGADVLAKKDWLERMQFNEQPVTIRIEENNRTDYPERWAACYVNGEPSEVLHQGKWIKCGWLPIGVPIITKRKFVEVLARAKPDTIRTVHDDATVERPTNKIERRTTSSYPLSVLRDDNPGGHEWLSALMYGQ